MLRTVFVVLIMLPGTITVIGLETVVVLLLLPFRRFRNDVLHRINCTWGKLFFLISGSSITVDGLENFDRKKAHIIMMNHQGAFDIFLLFAVLPGQFRWLSKDTYFKIPVLGWFMTLSGYVSIVREKKKSAYESMLAAGVRLKENRSIAIFPEGTRSHDGEVQRFKPGILILTENYPAVPILPVVIHGTTHIMKKGSFAIKPSHVHVEILPPFDINAVHGDRNAKISALERLMRDKHVHVKSKAHARSKHR
ncbi:MAG: lysophospholipid acyltransferase family protein [Spirochaetota bacterium]